MAGNRVNRCATLDRTARKRRLRLSLRLHVCNLGNGTPHSMDCARGTKSIPRVTARAIIVHAIALRTRSTAKHTIHIHAVNGNEAVDLNAALVEEILGTT